MESINGNLKRKVFSGLFWKFGERITAQLVSTIVSIVLARLLAPENYGAVTMTLVFINLANVFVTSGFGSALIQKKEVDNIDYSSVFFINIIISWLLYGCLFIFAPSIANFYDMQILKPIIRVFALRIPLAAVNSIQQAYVARNMLFKKFFWSTLFGTIISGFVGILLAYCGYGVWALVAQYMTNCITDTIILWFTVRWRPQLVFSLKRTKYLIKYGWNILLSALISTGYEELRSLIIGKLYSASDLAFYNQGDKYPKLIVNNVNVSISSVLFPAISKVQDDTERVKNMTRKAIQICSYVIWPLMLGLAVLAETFVRLVLTEKWLVAVPYIRVFCFVYGLYPIHTANLEAIKALGRSELYLKLEIIKKIIGLVTLLIVVNRGPFVIASSLLITGIVSAFINAIPNSKLMKYSLKEQVSDIAPSFFMAVGMSLIVYFVTYLELSDMLTVALQITVGISVYLGLSFVTRNSSFIYLIGFLKERGKNGK